jgi:hypothetical protein
MEKQQVSSYSDGPGSAHCKTADAYGLRLGWGDRRVGLGVTMGARFARQGSALLVCAGFCWTLTCGGECLGRLGVWWWLPLQARARSAAFDRPTSRHIQ